MLLPSSLLCPTHTCTGVKVHSFRILPLPICHPGGAVLRTFQAAPNSLIKCELGSTEDVLRSGVQASDLKTLHVGPNSFFKKGKKRVGIDLRRLKNRLMLTLPPTSSGSTWARGPSYMQLARSQPEKLSLL